MANIMAEEIDSKVTRFMESELYESRFEHTVREIARGAGLSYSDVSKSVERLKIRDIIDLRRRGSNKKFTPYYYLSKLRKIVKNKKETLTTPEVINTEKNNSRPSTGGS